MPRRQSNAHSADVPRGVESPRLHLVLYAILLVSTPFIMLRAFLQDAVGRASASTFPLGGQEIPIVPVVAAAVAALLLALTRPRITRRRALTALLAIAMIAVGQRSTDLYFGHSFYELQQNWHYIAYTIFAFMVYRDLHPRGVSLARIFLVTFGLAAGCSIFDEYFQMHMSGRVFDTSDIAKDGWGSLIGMGILLFGPSRAGVGAGSWRRLRQRTLGGYLEHAPSVWVLLLALGYLFLLFGSVLTEPRYAGWVLLFTISSFTGLFLVFHLSRARTARWVMLGLAGGAVAVLAGSCLRQDRATIISGRSGLTFFRGLPVPAFDVMLRSNGSLRLVDKKHFFNHRDKTFLNRQKADVLLIGAGYEGQGGKGFPHASGSRFIYNPFLQDATQVIILRSEEACRRYNELKKQKKNVLLILHTSC